MLYEAFKGILFFDTCKLSHVFTGIFLLVSGNEMLVMSICVVWFIKIPRVFRDTIVREGSFGRVLGLFSSFQFNRESLHYFNLFSSGDLVNRPSHQRLRYP